MISPPLFVQSAKADWTKPAERIWSCLSHHLSPSPEAKLSPAGREPPVAASQVGGLLTRQKEVVG